MRISEIFERFFATRKCPSCGELLDYEHAREAFCDSCRARWEMKKAEPCPDCSQSVSECICMPKLLSKAGALCHRKVVPYSHDSAVRGTLMFIKKNKNPRICAFLASQMHERLVSDKYLSEMSAQDTLITFVPRGRRAMVRYGFDQSEMLCDELRRVSGIPARALLSRRAGGVEQKKLDAKERAKNVSSRFEVVDLAADEIKGKRIILVDDIVTTGASMAECTRALIRAGALSVIALSVATTYKE